MSVECIVCGFEGKEEWNWFPFNSDEQLYCDVPCMVEDRDYDWSTVEGWQRYIEESCSKPETIFEEAVDLELMGERILGQCEEHGTAKPCGLCGDDLGWIRARLIAACREIARLRDSDGSA